MKSILKPHHEYHQLLAYKIFMAMKSDPPYTTCEEALSIIKGMHAISRGMKQVVYLVGWRYDGHDSKCPAWFETNRHLMRPGDSDPLRMEMPPMRALLIERS